MQPPTRATPPVRGFVALSAWVTCVGGKTTLGATIHGRSACDERRIRASVYAAWKILPATRAARSPGFGSERRRRTVAREEFPVRRHGVGGLTDMRAEPGERLAEQRFVHGFGERVVGLGHHALPHQHGDPARI